MFHSYVLTVARRSIDIGRAQFLMDKDLARQTAEWVGNNECFLLYNRNWMGGAPYFLSKQDLDQAFWDYYCERHREKYGTSFEPDVSPDWN